MVRKRGKERGISVRPTEIKLPQKTDKNVSVDNFLLRNVKGLNMISRRWWKKKMGKSVRFQSLEWWVVVWRGSFSHDQTADQYWVLMPIQTAVPTLFIFLISSWSFSSSPTFSLPPTPSFPLSNLPPTPLFHSRSSTPLKFQPAQTAHIVRAKN